MKKILLKKDGKVSIFIPAPKSNSTREEIIANLESTGYEVVRYIEDKDIPESREYRDAWVDESDEQSIDVCCEKARNIALDRLRIKRNKALIPLDAEYIRALESGSGADKVIEKKQRLRDITIGLKRMRVKGKLNDTKLLNRIKKEEDKL